MLCNVDTTHKIFMNSNGNSFMQTTMVSLELKSTVVVEVYFFYTDGKMNVDQIRANGDKHLKFFAINQMEDTIVALANKNTHYGCKIVVKYGHKVDPARVRGLHVWCEAADNQGVPTRPLTIEFETGMTEVTEYFTEAMPVDRTKDGCRWLLASLRANIEKGDILDKVNNLSDLMRLKFQMLSNDQYEKRDHATAVYDDYATTGSSDWNEEIKVLLWKPKFVSVKGQSRGKETSGENKIYRQNANEAAILKGDSGNRGTKSVYGYKSASMVVELFVRMMTTSSEALQPGVDVKLHNGQVVSNEDFGDQMFIDIDNPEPKKQKVGPQVKSDIIDELTLLADISKLDIKPEDTGVLTGFNMGIDRLKSAQLVKPVKPVDNSMSNFDLAKCSCIDLLKKAKVDNDEQRIITLSHTYEDIHNFAICGVDCEEFALEVTVKQHADKHDEEGQRIENVVTDARSRTYTVDPGQLIKVTVKNWGKDMMSFIPVYFSVDGDEDYEERVFLKSGEDNELYPLQKVLGEADDGWILKTEEGKTFLKLIFKLEQ